MENFAFYEIVQNLATSKGVTIKQMEKDLGLSSSHAEKWKVSLPSFKSLVKIADYFSVSIDSLIGRGREIYQTEAETALIEKYRRLTASQQETILSNIDFLLSQSPLKKDTQIS